MKTPGSIRFFAAGVAALGLVMGPAASAAPRVPLIANPLVTLSVFGTAESRAALCAAGSVAAAAAANTTAQGRPNCVLPIGDAAPPPAVSNAAPPMAPYAPAAPYGAAAPNLWPLLGGLALFSAVFFLLDDAILGDGDGFEIDIPPPVDGSPT